MQTFLYLTECGWLPLPAPFSSAWSSVEQHGPSRLGKQTQRVCVCVYTWVCVIADLPLWNKTGSYIVHKIPLQNLAEAGGGGMDPFELSVLLLLLPSVALHPRGSNCGYRTLYSYEHNTLQVTQGTFMTNLHLFHKSVIKGCVDILMLICIFFFFKSGDPCCVPDWMMTAPRLLFSLSLR